MKPPNILLVLTDDQRFDTIAALGNTAIQTPNLDKLVARGTSFTRAHIPGGTCPAVCMPSRAMLHTGRSLFHLDREGQEIPEAHTTLGECFRAAGYETFGTGKWHNGTAAYARSFSDGGEIFFGGMDDHWNVPACHFDPSGAYCKQPFVRDPFGGKSQVDRHCDHMTPGTHSTDLFTQATLDFLDRRDEEKPFFAYVSFMAPHDPRTSHARYHAIYPAEHIQLPPNFQAEHAFDTGALRIRDELLAAQPRDPDEVREHIADYYAMITHLDGALGRMLDKLEEGGELENTLVVFTGDNGLAVGQHGLMGKQSLYEHSLRVPLIFAGPGVPAGQRSDALCYLYDLFPTLCELTGVERPVSVEGVSLDACMRGLETTVREDLYLVYDAHIRGVSDGGHKLIRYATGEAQLFDLRTDPWECENLAGRASLASVQSHLQARLEQYRELWDDARHPKGEAYWERLGS